MDIAKTCHYTAFMLQTMNLASRRGKSATKRHFRTTEDYQQFAMLMSEAVQRGDSNPLRRRKFLYKGECILPYAAMLLVVGFWGSAAAVGKSLGTAETALDLALWRVGLGLSLLLLLQAGGMIRDRLPGGAVSSMTGHPAQPEASLSPSSQRRCHPSVRRLIPIWLAGVLGYGIMIWLFFAAARATLASHLVLILSMAPICTMLLNRLAGGRGDARAFLPAGLSLVGIAVMVAPSLSGSHASLMGDGMAILALLAFSGYTVLTKRFGRGMATTAVNVQGMFAGVVFLWMMILFTEGEPLPAEFSSSEQWLAIGYLGLAATGLAYWLYAWALTRLPMERIMPLIYLQPLVGVLLSVLWLNESLKWNVVIGMCGVVGGLIWNHRLSQSSVTLKS
ncbi:DMT family transporter [Paenibacillus sp. HB172176]|uniref:DMT family transporter n=1 Tax=Paenibacillus sp. HB172176 TaxID=2493690 RepID=UPI001439D914|nr:DMT family transporter [Paenibacillus sp. HB172176]